MIIGSMLSCSNHVFLVIQTNFGNSINNIFDNVYIALIKTKIQLITLVLIDYKNKFILYISSCIITIIVVFIVFVIADKFVAIVFFDCLEHVA